MHTCICFFSTFSLFLEGNNVMDIFNNVAPSVVFVDAIEEVKANVRNTDKWSKWSENDNSQNKIVDNKKRLQMA